MDLVRWEPFRELRRRDLFEDLFRDVLRGEGEGIEPPVEVAEADGEVTVKMAVPGVEKDALQVTVDDDTLTVRGEIRKEKEEKGKHFHRQEFRYGAFQRTVALPTEVNGGKAAATLKNGILIITIPKSTESKAHQVKVAVS